MFEVPGDSVTMITPIGSCRVQLGWWVFYKEEGFDGKSLDLYSKLNGVVVFYKEEGLWQIRTCTYRPGDMQP